VKFDAVAFKAGSAGILEGEGAAFTGGDACLGKVFVADLFFAIHVDDAEGEVVHGLGSAVMEYAFDAEGASDEDIHRASIEVIEGEEGSHIGGLVGGGLGVGFEQQGAILMIHRKEEALEDIEAEESNDISLIIRAGIAQDKCDKGDAIPSELDFA
jgi:hypothetical protein